MTLGELSSVEALDTKSLSPVHGAGSVEGLVGWLLNEGGYCFVLIVSQWGYLGMVFISNFLGGGVLF